VAIAVFESPIVGIGALLICYPAIRSAPVLRRVLGNRLTRFMADTSYAVYLLHGFFISMVGAWLFDHPGFVRLAPPLRVLVLILITVAGSYAMAWLVHRWIELPGIALGRGLLRRQRPRAPERVPVAAVSTPAA
jgi:peptidoglycan/LPS O-acetylase OafA/YrhL